MSGIIIGGLIRAAIAALIGLIVWFVTGLGEASLLFASYAWVMSLVLWFAWWLIHYKHDEPVEDGTVPLDDMNHDMEYGDK